MRRLGVIHLPGLLERKTWSQAGSLVTVITISRSAEQLSSERDAWRWRGAYLQQWDECVSRWLDERPGLSNLTDNPTAVRARVRARILAGLVLSWMFRLQYPP